MTRYSRMAAAAVLALFGALFVAAPAKAAAPSISSISPNSGLAGISVTLTGVDLAPFTTVKFDGVATSYTIVNNNQIVAIAPAHANGPVNVIVQTPYGTSNAVTFTYGTGGGGGTPTEDRDVGPGTSITTEDGPFAGGSWCTIAAVGYDDNGNPVAITAGHCNTRPGEHQPVKISPTVAEPDGYHIGTFETMNTMPSNTTTYPVNSSVDYAVILLDLDLVDLINTTPTGQVYNQNNTTAPTPGVTTMAKYGQMSGYVSNCPITAFENNTIYSSGCTNIPGDSGGGVLIAGGFAGVNSAVNPFACCGRTNQFTHISGILADIALQGSNTVGIGFEPLP